MPELVLNSLFTEEHPDGKRAWVTRPLILLSRRLKGIVLIPSGFFTDYTSHPLRTARGRYNRGSVGHDYLYEAQTIVRLPDSAASSMFGDAIPEIFPVSRAEADAAYLEWMEDLGVNLIQRHAFYAAVRAGGWVPWSRSDRDEHRPYYYGLWEVSQDIPAEFFGVPKEAWLEALQIYADSFQLHRQFDGGPAPEPDPVPF